MKKTSARQTTSLIIDALKMAVARLNKDDKVILHSDQGSQYSSYKYKKFAKEHNIILNMSRRGNCLIMQLLRAFLRL